MPISAIPSNLERIGDRSSPTRLRTSNDVDEPEGTRSVTAAADGQPSRARVIGHSRSGDRCSKASQVAGTDTTVFLQGESGTGKEVIARFIHRASPRRSGPFIALNCGPCPSSSLSQSCSATNVRIHRAQQAKASHVELAAGGVLFLDEVSEMSPMAQAKLLRVRRSASSVGLAARA
jgi:DNA-binding NtrC family response regulator